MATIDLNSIQRLAAFSRSKTGGNPAGVWLGESFPTPTVMQALAAAIGYSETAFLVPIQDRDYQIRYYSPTCEVPFCGHATIAAGAALGQQQGLGDYTLMANVGPVPITVEHDEGQWQTALTSVIPQQRSVDSSLVQTVLQILNWSEADLDCRIPPIQAYAGAWHLVLAVTSRECLDNLNYEFAALKTLMEQQNWLTLQLIWQTPDPYTFHSRNPFPVGGVIEDPATGAAAAALGGYLRDTHKITAPQTLLIHQGIQIGRPSEITIEVPPTGGIRIKGSVVWL